MADIATLGIAVKSEQVVTANDNLKRFQGAAASAERAAAGLGSTSEKTAGAISKVSNEASSATGWLGKLRTVAGAVTAALATNAIIGYADAWSDMQSRVGAAIGNMEAAPATMARLVQIANESYSSTEQTVEAFSRNVMILRDLGRGAKDAEVFTAALNNALVLTATRGERAASVQNALSKAMAVGTLQADGLETVLANGGAVAEALAKALGTNVNGLRKFASEGKITSAVIADALISNAQDFSDRVQEMPSTVQDAIQRLRNNFTEFVGTMDNGTGASARLSDAIMLVANNLNTVARMGGVAATAIGTYYAQSLVRATLAKIGFTSATTAGTGALGLLSAAAVGARNAVNALTAAMARNPFGLIAVALATVVSSLVMFGDQIQISADGVVTFQDYAVAAFNAVGSAIQSVGTYFNETFGGLAGYAATAFSAIGGVISAYITSWLDMMKGYANSMIGTFKSVADAVSIIVKVGFENGFTVAGQVALNAVVEAMALITASVANAVNDMFDRIGGVVEYANMIPVVDLPNPLESWKIDAEGAANAVRGWKVEVTGAAAEAGDAIADAFATNANTDFIGAGAAAWSAAAREIAEARESAEAEAAAALAGIGGAAGAGAGTGGADSDAAKKAAKEAEKLGKAYDGIVQKANQRITDLKNEQAALGMTAEQAARLRYETDLLHQAQSAGITLSASQAAELRGLAATMASVEAETARAKEQIEFAKQATGGFISDLRSSLNQGKGFFESFGNAVVNVLNKIVDRIQDGLIDALFSMNGGGSRGGGGMFGGLVSGLGRILGFQSGGYTGNGPENRVAGLVHGREFVMNAGATAQYRPMLEAMNSNRPLPAPVQASGGAANGNVTVNSPATFHIDARGAQQGVGEEIRTAIEVYDKQRRRNLGREIAEARNMNRAGF